MAWPTTACHRTGTSGRTHDPSPLPRRLAFACWRGIDENPWFVVNAIGRFLQPPPPPAEGKSPTGPFVLADFGMLFPAAMCFAQASEFIARRR